MKAKYWIVQSMTAMSVVLCGSQAMAQMVGPEMHACITESNGFPFSYTSPSEAYAQGQVAQMCRDDRRTNNDECNVNVTCAWGSVPPAIPYISCDTSSDDLVFAEHTRDAALTMREAVLACQQDRRTNNDLCAANVGCNDRYNQPYQLCTSMSRQIPFTVRSRDPQLGARIAVARCQGDRRTDNNECQMTAYCQVEGGQPLPPAPAPQPMPIPQPMPPAPMPVPVPMPIPAPLPPNPAGPVFGGHPCNLFFCQMGDVCSNGCPRGAACNFVNANVPYYRVVTCGGRPGPVGPGPRHGGFFGRH